LKRFLRLKHRMPFAFLIILALICSALPVPLAAQETARIENGENVEKVEPSGPVVEQTPIVEVPQPVEVPRTNIAGQFLKNQRKLWAAPAKVKRGDVKWLVPLGVGAVAFLATDQRVADAAREADNLRSASRFLSKFGGGGPLAAGSVGMYGIGKLAKNENLSDTGKVAGTAVLHTQLVVQGLKVIFNRERPNKMDGQGGFWGGGRSFPSGHAATSFAFATVVANKYKNNKLAVVGAYGLATAVSLSRVGGMNHHPSDIAIGAAIGHLIGRFILRQHSENN
jgi:hypothetical protein